MLNFNKFNSNNKIVSNFTKLNGGGPRSLEEVRDAQVDANNRAYEDRMKLREKLEEKNNVNNLNQPNHLNNVNNLNNIRRGINGN